MRLNNYLKRMQDTRSIIELARRIPDIRLEEIIKVRGIKGEITEQKDPYSTEIERFIPIGDEINLIYVDRKQPSWRLKHELRAKRKLAIENGELYRFEPPLALRELLKYDLYSVIPESIVEESSVPKTGIFLLKTMIAEKDSVVPFFTYPYNFTSYKSRDRKFKAIFGSNSIGQFGMIGYCNNYSSLDSIDERINSVEKAIRKGIHNDVEQIYKSTKKFINLLSDQKIKKLLREVSSL